MSLINFLSQRFHAIRTLPRSVRLMRLVAIAGIAIAVAALVIATSVGRGFEKKYIDGLLKFNAHIIVMESGEIPDPSVPLKEIAAFRVRSEDENKMCERWGWALPIYDSVYGFFRNMEYLHADLGMLLYDYPFVSNVWMWFSPARLNDMISEGIGEVFDKLRESSVRGVKGTSSFIYREALAIGGGNIRGVVVKGIDAETIGDVNELNFDLDDKSLSLTEALKSSDGDEVNLILGKVLHEKFGGSKKIKLMIPKEGDDKFLEASVVGVFESGIHDYDSQFILLSLPAIRQIYQIDGNKVSGIEVRLDNPMLASITREAMDEVLGPRYETTTWYALNQDLLAAVKLEKLVSAIIMGMMVIVAALNIMAVIVLMMIHRINELAILKAIGLSDRLVERLFIRGGMVVDISGTLLGLVLGISISASVGHFSMIPLQPEIYLIDSLPIDISLPICGMIAIFCIVIGYLASKIASRRLAKAPLMEGLICAR